jgi:glycosyltransferase involved in cell wall biosynthesis
MLEHRLTKRPISVIYNAAGTFTEDQANKAPNVRPRGAQRLVYMGSFMDYKNVEVLIDGMKFLPEYELHLLSRIKPERQSELEGRVQNGFGRVVFHNGVSEDEYHRELDQAVALVTGSRDEGFGIPLIESMSRGVPVVVSDIEIFKEIGGEVALFFDQESPEDFAKKVRLLESNPQWTQRSIDSRAHAEQFNWERSAGDLIEMISRL